jgi:hypothetical protein
METHLKKTSKKHTHIIKQNRGIDLELSMETHMKRTRQKHTHIIKQTTKMINKEKYSRNRGIDLFTKTLMSKKAPKKKLTLQPS